MATLVPEQVPRDLAATSEPDLPLRDMDKPALQSSQALGLEQEQVPLTNGGKAKKPLSFYMTFFALNICVLLVSLDATALSVAVPVSQTVIHHGSLND